MTRPLTRRSAGCTATNASNGWTLRAGSASPRRRRSRAVGQRVADALDVGPDCRSPAPGRGRRGLRPRRAQDLGDLACRQHGLTGFAMPAASAEQREERLRHERQEQADASPAPTPSAWNAFAACVHAAEENRDGTVCAGSSARRSAGRRAAGASGCARLPMRSASYVLSAAIRSRYGTASNARTSAAVASDGQASPMRRSSRCRVSWRSGGG